MLDENGNSVYNQMREMVWSTMLDCFELLENYTGANEEMHRQRVKIADGQYRWVQGKTHDELNDAIVKAYIESGRISEFLGIVWPKPKKQTNFRELGEKWITTYKGNLKETSKTDYRYQLDKLLYPTFADMNIQDIKLSDVQNFLNTHSNTAKSTLRKSVIVLDQIFNLAIHDELTDSNPIDKKMLKYPAVEEKEREALSQEQFNDIVSHIDKLDRLSDKQMLSLFCFTGMRRGEISGLKWEDIDVEHGVIHVTRNVTYPHNEPIVGTPKSKKGYRTIPLDPRLKRYVANSGETGFIFGGEAPLTRSAFMAIWTRIGKQINLYGASCHVFRHTYATMLNNAGVDPKTIQSILGHSDISVTMNIYTHTGVENVLSAGQKFTAMTMHN